MQCPTCSNTIHSGTELRLANGGADLRHCPFCLGILPRVRDHLLGAFGEAPPNVSVMRFAMRSTVRERFVDALLRGSPDGSLRCPDCDHPLTKSDELALRYGLWFRCRWCCRDLVHLAYREEAYRPARWLPVISALDVQAQRAGCHDCTYLGAVANACQQALSCMPDSYPAEQARLRAVLAQPSWRVPECDWSSSCDAVRQYRLRAAQGLSLL